MDTGEMQADSIQALWEVYVFFKTWFVYTALKHMSAFWLANALR